MDAQPPHTIVVVSHTHWDREWYHPLGVLRQRLVALVDTLLDAPDGLPFLLDGQSIVLDDYRRLRPERAPRLAAALREGQIEAGPWYVLSDMLIPSGEALVRNLLEGIRIVHEAGGTPPRVLYSPDAFGHGAAGPALAVGFGMRVAIVWRGFGGPEHPVQTVVRWAHAGGDQVLLYHLPMDGYEVGSSLPITSAAAAGRWRLMREAVLGFNSLRVTLLPNGADHHARQNSRPEAIAALAAAAAPHLVVADTLSGFASRIEDAAADVALPQVCGELRDSTGWTWSLQGTFATRAHQKRMNAQVERLLIRDTEPWAALAWFARDSSQSALRFAWKTLLSTHPHDTLCGCSADEVATAADLRWSDARAQSEEIRDGALRALVRCDPAAQREMAGHWQPTLVLRNPAARARGGTVHLRLVDAPVHDPVGPGSASRSHVSDAPLTAPASWTGDEFLQLLHCDRQFDRVESPLHYPHNAVVRVSDVMAWIEPMPGYAVQPVSLADLSNVVAPVPSHLQVRGSDSELLDHAWRILSSPEGVVATHATTGARIQPLGWLESTTDAGDTYTPALRGQSMLAHWSTPRVQACGPILAAWDQIATICRPYSSIAAATEPAARELPPCDNVVEVSATAALSITAGTDWIELTIRGENPAGDHRLRWVLPLPAGIRTDHIIADAAFGAVRRESNYRDPREWTAEARLPTAPLHRWLYLGGESYGLGIVSDGLAEYELLPDGHLAITLVRAVGELSRRDVPDRPGHAGWPLSTPLAQCRGPFEGRFAIIVLPNDDESAIGLLEQAADDFLLPVTGDTWRGVATALESFAGLTLEGDGLAFSSAKRSDDGEWLVLRCINQRSSSVPGSWHLPRPATEVRLSRLDETPGIALGDSGTRIRFEAPPHAIVTLLVR